MKRIGLLSDTHGYLDPKIFHYFENVDEIWHAGDVGNIEVLDELKKFKPLRAIYGNIDDQIVRREYKETLRFWCEEVEVVLTHIGGKPGKYSIPAMKELQKGSPQLFICGHSHILLVKMDLQKNMLWMNPGACGIKGFHSVRTILRFVIDGKKIEQLEAIELGKRV